MRRVLGKITDILGGGWALLLSGLRGLRKDADALLDHTKPHGWVEVRLIYASGPKAGEVYRQEKVPMKVPVLGRNIVTGFVSDPATPPFSGRDCMRRLIVPSSFSGSLSGDDYKIGKIELGSGTTAESSADDELDTPISGSTKDITSVEFDSSNPYVTFIAQWSESEANQTISEFMLWSTDGTHPYARKVISGFDKSNLFTMQVRWTIRF